MPEGGAVEEEKTNSHFSPSIRELKVIMESDNILRKLFTHILK